jgi:hypothetical protein
MIMEMKKRLSLVIIGLFLSGNLMIFLSVNGLENNDNIEIPELETEWVVTWGGKYNDGIGWDVVKHDGFLYVTGHVKESESGTDVFISKFDLDGNLIWEKTWGSPSEWWRPFMPPESGLVLAVDDPYIYLGGTTRIGPTNQALLQKYDLDGNLIWTKTWGRCIFGHHEVNGLAIVGDYIYLTHWDTRVSYLGMNPVLKKFNKDGDLIWSTTWGNPLLSQSTADGHIYADETGIWVTGRINGGYFSKGDAYLIKIDPNGQILWLETWGGEGWDQGLNLFSDGKNIYVEGGSNSHGDAWTFGDALLLKYDMDGSLIWNVTWGGTKAEYSRSMAVDGDNLYVGTSTVSYGEGLSDTVLQKYDTQDGALIDQWIWGGTGGDEVTASMVVDQSSVYLVGSTTSTDTGTIANILIKAQKSSLSK